MSLLSHNGVCMLKSSRLYWVLLCAVLGLASIVFVLKSVLDAEVYKIAAAGFENLLFFVALTFLCSAMFEVGRMKGVREKETKKAESSKAGS